MTDLRALLAQIETTLAECDASTLPDLPKLTPEQLGEIRAALINAATQVAATIQKTTTPDQPTRRRNWIERAPWTRRKRT